jgi:tetratricopeptide (TPR) repeat protein
MRRLVALSYCVCALIAGCDSSYMHNNAGNDHLTRGHDVLALNAYFRAQVADPDDPVPYFNAGLAYDSMGDLELAEAVLIQAAGFGDMHFRSDAYFNLGTILAVNGDLESGLARYRAALKTNPENNRARINHELLVMTATAIAIEMQTDPDQASADEDATPTPQPSDSQDGSASPAPPPPLTSVGIGMTPQPDVPPPDQGNLSLSDGPLTADDARRLLQSIAGNRQQLPRATGTPVSEQAADGHNDW